MKTVNYLLLLDRWFANYTKSLFCIISGAGNYAAPLLR